MSEKFKALEKRYNLLVEEAQNLHKQNLKLRSEVNILNAKINEANQASNISRQTMTNAIIEQNNIKEAYSMEISELKNKIAELEG